MHNSTLFRPFTSPKLNLPNRLVMAPMTRRSSPGGVPDATVAKYYQRRAEGGVGLIITEGTTIARPAASNDVNIPNFHTDDSLAGWATVVAAVHAAGGKIAPQIWHQGLARAAGSGPHPDAPSEGPSAGDGAGHAMSDADISQTIDAYAAAAVSAQRLGFDAVELHGAHGYLIDQFLWAGTNHRTDGYGGDAAQRTRFAAEVVRGVRSAVGAQFPLIFRFSQWKLQDYGARLAESPAALEQILAPLVEAGVDIFHASTRRYWEPEFPGSNLNLAGWTHKLTGLPTISVGSVGLGGEDFMSQLRGASTSAPTDVLDDLVRRMEANEFDLIAVGRALIGDPEWPAKIRENRLQELVAFDKTALQSLV